MPRLASAFCVLFLTLGLTGCGSGEYAPPDIDPEEAAQHEEEINKAMEEEMQKQMGGGRK